MFESFTDLARKVIINAQEEARELHHDYIGTEHILLGILRISDTHAANMLNVSAVTLESARARVEREVGKGQFKMIGHMPLTPRVKKVFELALSESRALDHKYIGPEHLLLALEKEGDGVAVHVLTELGVDLARLRQYTLRGIAAFDKWMTADHLTEADGNLS